MENNVNVYDDFLPQEEFDELAKNCKDVEWKLVDNVVDGKVGEQQEYNKHDWQFEHYFYELPFHNSSNTFNKIGKLLEKINPFILYRAKMNLNPNTETIIEHGFHKDIWSDVEAEKLMSAVYYINSNDGYTKFEDDSIVESVANRLVTFPTSIMHTGSTCTDVRYRQVLNLMYIPYGEQN